MEIHGDYHEHKMGVYGIIMGNEHVDGIETSNTGAPVGSACLGAGISEMEFMKALFPLDYRRIYRRMSGMTFGA